MSLALRPLFACMILMASGCAHFQAGGTEQNYETVVGTPNRDTEQAIRETRRAEKYVGKGEFDKAERSLQKALVADVSYGPAHNNLGKLYFRKRKLYLAAWEFEYAIRTMPDIPEPHNNLGLVYEEVGKLEDAISYYSTAYELESTNPEYIGNLVRARLRLDDQDPLAKPLLEELLIYDDRPHWIGWAQELIGLRKLPDPTEYEEFTTVEVHDDPVRYDEGPDLNEPRSRSDAESLPAPEPNERLMERLPDTRRP